MAPMPSKDPSESSSSKIVCLFSIPGEYASIIIAALAFDSFIQSIRDPASGKHNSGATCISEAIRTTLLHSSMLHIGSPA